MITSFFPQDFCLISAMLQGHVQAESSLSAYTLRKIKCENPKPNNNKNPLVQSSTVVLAKYCF